MSRNSYTVTFENDTVLPGTAILFQRPGGVAMPVAWQSRHCNPHEHVTFTWTLDYSFVWAVTGALQPGILVQPGQSWPADLDSGNEVTLAPSGNSYTFTNPTAGPQPGVLGIYVDGPVPPNTLSVGIAIAQQPTNLMQAQSHVHHRFAPQAQYWIAFGNFPQGVIVDASTIDNPAQIVFPANVFSMNATLSVNGTWTVSPA